MLTEKEKELEERQGEATVIEGPSEERKKLYLESYGCQMNFSDSEIVASILKEEGYRTTARSDDADVVLLNTCSIRENAEQRVRQRLRRFWDMKKEKPGLVIGVLGCMAERLKKKFLEEEKIVDVVVGPDAYRDLPRLIQEAEDGRKAVNTLLSREETYADINPIKLNSNGVTAFISIMRGCDNMCSFCVVPFTRGRERSRDPRTIEREARYLYQQGYKEVTLLGQNVDSYRWNLTAKGELKDPSEGSEGFADLLERVAGIAPDLRVRFSTSHPKDMTDDVLHAMARHENICNYIHLPVQAGSNRVLRDMNRGYTREWYLERISAIRSIIPDCAISTDIMTGFCGETEEEHKETIDMMERVEYDLAYMFQYSERPKTLAARKFEDDVPQEAKKARLNEVIELQKEHSLRNNQRQVGKEHTILVEGPSKKSDADLFGRNSQNAVVVFPREHYRAGDYVRVMVDDCTPATLLGRAIEKVA
jgi:tRNA-2-methylthio-N6-dimethylallyladenosine synthase